MLISGRPTSRPTSPPIGSQGLDTSASGWLNPTDMSVDLTVVVVSYKTPDLVRQCLRSVFGRTWRHRYEVIVVDNASGDGSAEMIGAEFPDVRVIANATNVGFARACN